MTTDDLFFRPNGSEIVPSRYAQTKSARKDTKIAPESGTALALGSTSVPPAVGFEYEGRRYRSLSNIAAEITGTHWNGFAFFGVDKEAGVRLDKRRGQNENGANGTVIAEHGSARCAIYTRKSTEEGLEQSFNTLDAQREAGEAFINSQRHEGCRPAAEIR